MASPKGTSVENRDHDLARALSNALANRLGEGIRIEGLSRLTGGASRETWAFDAIDAAGTIHELILRRDFPGGAGPPVNALLGEEERFDRAGEFRLFEVLFERGIPVPRPILLPTGQKELTDSFVMERIEGESLPRQLLRDDTYADARRRLPAQLGATLARIHSLVAKDVPGVPVQSTAYVIDLARRVTTRFPKPRPIFELALAWLTERQRERSEPRLVHGDFRNGNFVVGPEGLRAVLDWEYAYLGDPVADLAFLCLKPWRYGRTADEVGGFGPREELYRAYEAAGGDPVDPEAMRFWEVLYNLRWGSLCLARGFGHVLGIQRSVESAAIGRRVAETEYDILELIG